MVYISSMETAKVFPNGRSQAVRLPKEFRFDTDEVFITRLGNAVVLIPKKDSWNVLFDVIDDFTDDFMDSREQPQVQQERDFNF